jgi:hypothetical protein
MVSVVPLADGFTFFVGASVASVATNEKAATGIVARFAREYIQDNKRPFSAIPAPLSVIFALVRRVVSRQGNV